MKFTEPLAYHMRPTHIDEVAGQEHVIGKNTILYKNIIEGNVQPFLLYGEPGIEKTSITNAIAGTVDKPFYILNATTSGKKDVQEVIDIAKKLRDERKEAIESITDETSEEEKENIYNMTGNVILFIDEVHRFNKAQQDVLLPCVEEGLVILIGATTSNPYHDVNPAIRSRMGLIKQLKRLEAKDIKKVLLRALENEERGLASYHPDVEDELLELIAKSSNGEVRSSLSALELAVLGTDENEEGKRVVKKETILEVMEGKGFNHDKDGDEHYNVLSALHKSVRGSDTDAALFYAARLIEGGDLLSLLRRLVIIACEDIGLAEPMASVKAETSAQICERVGFPEAKGVLSELIVYLCNCPKSNSGYSAIFGALADVESGNIGEIPMHLRDTHYKSAHNYIYEIS